MGSMVRQHSLEGLLEVEFLLLPAEGNAWLRDFTHSIAGSAGDGAAAGGGGSSSSSSSSSGDSDSDSSSGSGSGNSGSGSDGAALPMPGPGRAKIRARHTGSLLCLLEVNPRVSSSVCAFDAAGNSPYIDRLVVPYLRYLGLGGMLEPPATEGGSNVARPPASHPAWVYSAPEGAACSYWKQHFHGCTDGLPKGLS